MHSYDELLPWILSRTIIDANGCCLYLGRLDYKGYGRVKVPVCIKHDFLTTVTGVHNLVYYLHHGKIAQFVLHKCDVRRCCEISHLYEGSHRDNVRDRNVRGRSAKGTSHAKAKLTEDDVRNIRREHNGTNILPLAQKYNVHKSAIFLIVTGKNWKHIPFDGSVKYETRKRLGMTEIREIQQIYDKLKGRRMPEGIIDTLVKMYNVEVSTIYRIGRRKGRFKKG